MQVIRLQQQRLPRVRDVRQISHGVAEARRHDENDYRIDHHEAAEYYEPPRYPRLLHHGMALLFRLRLHPIRHDHAHDRREIFTEEEKNAKLTFELDCHCSRLDGEYIIEPIHANGEKGHNIETR